MSLAAAYDRAGDTGREPRVDAPWASFFERVPKHHHKTASAPSKFSRAGRTVSL